MNGRPSAEDRRDFAAWRDASPAHEQAYQQARAFWSDLATLGDELHPDDDAALSESMAKIREMRRRRRGARAAASVVVALAALVVGSWLWLARPHLLQDLAADYVSPRGELRTVALADGSTLLLDADSAVSVELGPQQRRVAVLRGTVFLTVTPSAVPFVVDALDGEARVLGTAFEVALDEGGQVTVTLDSGRVEVAAVDDEVVLSPGESVAYGQDGLGELRKVDIEEVTAWRQGRLIFTNARLADVLERIGRYRPGRILVLDGALAQTRVSGNISLRDTDAALDALRSTVDFPMHTVGPLTIIGP